MQLKQSPAVNQKLRSVEDNLIHLLVHHKTPLKSAASMLNITLQEAKEIVWNQSLVDRQVESLKAQQ